MILPSRLLLTLFSLAALLAVPAAAGADVRSTAAAAAHAGDSQVAGEVVVRYR